MKSRPQAAAARLVILMLVVSVLLSTAAVACAGNTAGPQSETGTILSLTSSAFKEGGKIPDRYTCDGQDISPPLAWDEPPPRTRTLALTVEDPDAPGGTFTHWVVFNIPAADHQLVENVPAQEQLENGASQGKNDFGKIGYGGPCPPRGPAHHYRFTVYALESSLDLKPGASGKQVNDAMKGHVLAQGQLVGTCQH